MLLQSDAESPGQASASVARAAAEVKHAGVGHMAIATVSLYAFGFHVLTRSALVRMGLLTMGAPWATEMSHDLDGPGW